MPSELNSSKLNNLLCKTGRDAQLNQGNIYPACCCDATLTRGLPDLQQKMLKNKCDNQRQLLQMELQPTGSFDPKTGIIYWPPPAADNPHVTAQKILSSMQTWMAAPMAITIATVVAATLGKFRRGWYLRSQYKKYKGKSAEEEADGRMEEIMASEKESLQKELQSTLKSLSDNQQETPHDKMRYIEDKSKVDNLNSEINALSGGEDSMNELGRNNPELYQELFESLEQRKLAVKEKYTFSSNQEYINSITQAKMPEGSMGDITVGANQDGSGGLKLLDGDMTVLEGLLSVCMIGFPIADIAMGQNAGTVIGQNVEMVAGFAAIEEGIKPLIKVGLLSGITIMTGVDELFQKTVNTEAGREAQRRFWANQAVLWSKNLEEPSEEEWAAKNFSKKTISLFKSARRMGKDSAEGLEKDFRGRLGELWEQLEETGKEISGVIAEQSVGYFIKPVAFIAAGGPVGKVASKLEGKVQKQTRELLHQMQIGDKFRGKMFSVDALSEDIESITKRIEELEGVDPPSADTLDAIEDLQRQLSAKKSIFKDLYYKEPAPPPDPPMTPEKFFEDYKAVKEGSEETPDALADIGFDDDNAAGEDSIDTILKTIVGDETDLSLGTKTEFTKFSDLLKKSLTASETFETSNNEYTVLRGIFKEGSEFTEDAIKSGRMSSEFEETLNILKDMGAISEKYIKNETNVQIFRDLQSKYKGPPSMEQNVQELKEAADAAEKAVFTDNDGVIEAGAGAKEIGDSAANLAKIFGKANNIGGAMESNTETLGQDFKDGAAEVGSMIGTNMSQLARKIQEGLLDTMAKKVSQETTDEAVETPIKLAVAVIATRIAASQAEETTADTCFLSGAVRVTGKVAEFFEKIDVIGRGMKWLGKMAWKYTRKFAIWAAKGLSQAAEWISNTAAARGVSWLVKTVARGMQKIFGAAKDLIMQVGSWVASGAARAIEIVSNFSSKLFSAGAEKGVIGRMADLLEAGAKIIVDGVVQGLKFVAEAAMYMIEGLTESFVGKIVREGISDLVSTVVKMITGMLESRLMGMAIQLIGNLVAIFMGVQMLISLISMAFSMGQGAQATEHIFANLMKPASIDSMIKNMESQYNKLLPKTSDGVGVATYSFSMSVVESSIMCGNYDETTCESLKDGPARYGQTCIWTYSQDNPPSLVAQANTSPTAKSLLVKQCQLKIQENVHFPCGPPTSTPPELGTSGQCYWNQVCYQPDKSITEDSPKCYFTSPTYTSPTAVENNSPSIKKYNLPANAKGSPKLLCGSDLGIDWNAIKNMYVKEYLFNLEYNSANLEITSSVPETPLPYIAVTQDQMFGMIASYDSILLKIANQNTIVANFLGRWGYLIFVIVFMSIILFIIMN